MSDHECEEAITQLYAYLDGELEADVIVRVETHLRRCSPCLEAYDFESELRKVIAAKCQDQLPQDAKQRILEVLDRLDEGSGGDRTPTGL